jgi:PAS domain S-box-containing protein
MNWQLTPFVIPLLLATAISVAAAIYVWVTRHHIPRSRMAVLLLVAGAIWMLGTAVESASTDLTTKTVSEKLEYLGICILPAAWLVFTLHYTGRSQWLNPIGRILISIVPLVTFILILSNEAHGLIWQDAWLDTSGRYAVRRTIYGPALWAFLAFTYTVFVVGIYFVVQEFVRSGRLRRWQASGVLLAVLVPLGLSALEQVPFRPSQGQVEGTPLALGLILPIVAWSFYRLRVRDIVPVARDAVIESMGDAVLVLDPQHRVVDHNPAAGQLMVTNSARAKGHLLRDIWPEAASQLNAMASTANSGRIAVQDSQGRRQTYDARVFPLTDWRGRTASQVVVLRDITQQAEAEAKVADALDDQRVLLHSSAVLTSSLDLDEVLLGLAEQLLLVSGCHLCMVHEWDKNGDQVRALAEHARAFWPSAGGDSYRLADYPTTTQVLRSGKPTLITSDMDDPELDLMAESGTSELLMVPLRAGHRIVGLVELASVRPGTIGESSLQVVETILEEAASGLTEPLWVNSSALLLDIAHLLVRRTGAQSCTISHWSSEDDTVSTVAEYADLSWTASNGPSTRLADWPSSVRALVEGKSTITHLSDPDGDDEDQRELRRWGGQTVVTLPIMAKGDPIGLVELFDVLEEQTIDEGRIRLWRALVDQAAIAIENARLHAQAQAQLTMQMVLREAVAQISSALDLQTVVARIAEQIGRAVNATSAYVNDYDSDCMHATVLAEWFGADACAAERVSDLGTVYTDSAQWEWVESMLAGVHEISHLDDKNLPREERRMMQRYGAKTILYIPLQFKGRLLGYVEIWESRHRREFLPTEIALCYDIAQSAAVALDNARLYEQAQQEIIERKQVELAMLQRNRELVSLQAAVAATASNLDHQFILDTVTWEMANLLEVEDCSILEWDQAANTVTVIAEYDSSNLSEALPQAKVWGLADHPLRSQVLAERVARQTASTFGSPDQGEVPLKQQTNGGSLLILPLMFQDRVFGLVEITDSDAGREFNDREVSLAQMLANQAATAIENARLYEQAQTEIAIRREAEQALEQYADELERSNQDLQQFAYVASHDLQEPLRMVTSYLQLLQRRYQGQLDADADEFIDFATDGANRMRDLIRGLLNYSRVGTRGAPMQPIDCQEVLDKALDSLQVALAESDAQVTYHPLPTVSADATQLGQLFQNLIGNAIKFQADRRPEIHVDFEERDGGYLFSVRDNGIGIEPQYVERVFAIFQRLHTRDEYPGTGIGLAVCKRIVERHGGRIWVESQPGEGSTFYFTLPAERVSTDEVAGESSDGPQVA